MVLEVQYIKLLFDNSTPQLELLSVYHPWLLGDEEIYFTLVQLKGDLFESLLHLLFFFGPYKYYFCKRIIRTEKLYSIQTSN